MADDFDPDAYLANDTSSEGPPPAASDDFDPDEYLKAAPVQSEDFPARAARNIAHGVAPAVGGYLGAGVGASLGTAAAGAMLGAAAGPIGLGVGAVAGAIAGGFGGGYLGEKATEPFWDDAEQMAANAKDHPIESTIEGAIPAFAGMRFDKGASLLARGISAGMQGGIQGAQDYANEGHIDPGKAAAIAALGAVFPSTNRLGEKLVGAGERLVPGRPGRTANPAADQAHADVGDNSVETAVGDSVLAESPPGPDGVTRGNPQSAPDGSERDYGKETPPAEDDSQVTTGPIDPATKLALTQTNVQTIFRGGGQNGAQPFRGGYPQAEPKPVLPDAAQSDTTAPNAGEPSISPQRTAPEPVVEAGFPQEGEPVAAGQNDTTPLPEGHSERGAAAGKGVDIQSLFSKLPSEHAAAEPWPGLKEKVQTLASEPVDLQKVFKGSVPKEIKGETNNNPTDGQKDAGNYKKSRTGVEFGKKTAWETRAGEMRRSKADADEQWEVKSPYDYGYWNKTIAPDGDKIDRIQPPAGSPESGSKHFIIDQKKLDGRYDEPKTVTYVKDKDAAIDLYNRGFSDGKGPDRLHDITEVSKDELTSYLAKHTTKAPQGPYGKPMRPPEVLRADDEQGVPLQGTPPKVRHHGNFPIEGRVGPDGQPVTANTKAKAAALADEHKAIVDWFDKSEPIMTGHNGAPEETKGELLDRIKGAPQPKQAVFAPKEWLLAREARRVLSKPTPDNIKAYREAEGMLRGTDEDVENYRQGNRIGADIAMSGRTGDEALTAAENKNVIPGKNEEEDRVLEGIARGQRGEGKFDVPHEEAEKWAKSTPIKNAADLAKAEGKVSKKAITPGESALVKSVREKNVSPEDAARKAEALALMGRKSDKPKKEESTGRSVLSEAKPEDLARLVELSNKAFKGKGLSEAAIATHNLTADMPKHDSPTANLFSKLWNDTSGAVGGAANAARAKAVQAFLKPSKVTSSIARRPNKANEPFADYTRGVSDELHQLDNRNIMHFQALLDWISKLPKEANRAALERIFKAREADSAHVALPGKIAGKTNIESLSPVDKKVWDDHLADKVAEIEEFHNAIKALDPDLTGADIEHYISRIVKGDTSEYNMLRAQDDPLLNTRGVKVNAGMAKERVFHALEAVSNGKRHILQDRGEGKGFTLWDNYKGTRIRDPNYEFEANKVYTVTDKNGAKHHFIMREATTDEIMANARGRDGAGKPMKYYQNAALSIAMAHAQLGAMSRNLVELARISSTPEFKKLTAPIGSKKAEENGWIKSKLPNAGFRNLAMDPQLRYVFDDYAKSGFDSPEILRQLNQQVTKLLFWQPIAHIANVAAHWFVGRGFDNLNVAMLYGTGSRAIRSVMTQDITQKRYMDAGASMMYPSTRTAEFIEQAAKGVGEEFVRDPVTWGPLAKKLGLTPDTVGKIRDATGIAALAKLRDAIYRGSRSVMWAANDMFMTQRIMELEAKGHSTQEAIKIAEKDIPNYRIPTTLLGSGEKARILAQVMGDPAITSFGPYHVGMFNSYANIVNDAVRGNAGDRVDAIGKMMAMGVLAFVIYPALDKIAKVVTGNEDASQNRRGPLGVPSHIVNAIRGKEDYASALRSSVTLPPLWSTVLEAYFNKDFRGKSIVEPGTMQEGRYGKAAVQWGEHALRGLVSPYNTFAGAEKRGTETGVAGVAKSTARAVRDQLLDQKNPSDDARRFAQKQEQYNRRNEKSRDKRGGYGPLEELYGKAFPNR